MKTCAVNKGIPSRSPWPRRQNHLYTRSLDPSLHTVNLKRRIVEFFEENGSTFFAMIYEGLSPAISRFQTDGVDLTNFLPIGEFNVNGINLKNITYFVRFTPFGTRVA